MTASEQDRRPVTDRLSELPAHRREQLVDSGQVLLAELIDELINRTDQQNILLTRQNMLLAQQNLLLAGTKPCSEPAGASASVGRPGLDDTTEEETPVQTREPDLPPKDLDPEPQRPTRPATADVSAREEPEVRTAPRKTAPKKAGPRRRTQ